MIIIHSILHFHCTLVFSDRSSVNTRNQLAFKLFFFSLDHFEWNQSDILAPDHLWPDSYRKYQNSFVPFWVEGFLGSWEFNLNKSPKVQSFNSFLNQTFESWKYPISTLTCTWNFQIYLTYKKSLRLHFWSHYCIKRICKEWFLNNSLNFVNDKPSKIDL